MTEPVKRYDPNYSAISPADDLAVEVSDGMFVMHDDYARLEQECERLREALEKISRMQSHECTIGQNLKDAVLVACDALSAKPTEE